MKYQIICADFLPIKWFKEINDLKNTYLFEIGYDFLRYYIIYVMKNKLNLILFFKFIKSFKIFYKNFKRFYLWLISL